MMLEVKPMRALFTRTLAATVISAGLVCAVQAEPRHGLSVFGDLKYPADFTHFDYVNPDAPKGGRMALIGSGAVSTFNSLNGFILKGDAAQGIGGNGDHGYVFDTLMARAFDEPDAMYGLVAKTADVAGDGSSVIFVLRSEARFADGSPLTADDVVHSFTLIKENGHPILAQPLRDVSKAEALDSHTVRYTFTGDQTRNLPLVVAALPIFSKAYYTENSFDKTTLDPPLGSGPYKIGDVKQGRSITYILRDDYWAKDLPVNRGRYNFAELRYEYYRDRVAGFEAFKAGAFDLREEFTSKRWATGYEFPAVKNSQVVLATLPDGSPSGAQGFFLNMRRDKFSDVRVRKALGMAFDFEWTNKNLFYGLYERTQSFFENSPMKANGAPSAEELALLEPHRDRLPADVFKTADLPPVSNGSGQDRKMLRRASQLLNEAGWTIKDGKRRNAKGEVLDIEFLIFSPAFERIIAPYVKNLKILGAESRIRRVDPAQYEQRLKTYDFDVTTRRYVLQLTPGPELRNFWGSASANAQGGYNLSGIEDPVIDALIEKVIAAKSSKEMTTAARALDRVMRAGHYWVPHWFKARHNVAHWDKFSRPATKPLYHRGIIDTWWYDAGKAAKLKQN